MTFISGEENLRRMKNSLVLMEKLRLGLSFIIGKKKLLNSRRRGTVVQSRLTLTPHLIQTEVLKASRKKTLTM